MSADVEREAAAMGDLINRTAGELTARADALAAALGENARALRRNTTELRALPAALEKRLAALSHGVIIGD